VQYCGTAVALQALPQPAVLYAAILLVKWLCNLLHRLPYCVTPGLRRREGVGDPAAAARPSTVGGVGALKFQTAFTATPYTTAITNRPNCWQTQEVRHCLLAMFDVNWRSQTQGRGCGCRELAVALLSAAELESMRGRTISSIALLQPVYVLCIRFFLYKKRTTCMPTNCFIARRTNNNPAAFE
jgi:hypothetical protein